MDTIEQLLGSAEKPRGDASIDYVARSEASGTDLGKIIWKGRQWAVTDDGVEALDGSYVIAKNRLLGDQPDIYSWPEHVGTKTWVDVDDFLTAWLVALAIFAQPVDPELLRRSIALAPAQGWQKRR